MSNASYGRLIAALITAWFAFALLASNLHLFKAAPNLPPLALGIAALTPIAVFLSWFAASTGFRRFVLSLNPRTLTFVQSWRIAGFTFLALYAVGLLPGIFAFSAGWGDIFIGATAPLAALKLVNLRRRRGLIFWQLLGILDLVLAVTLGATAQLIDPRGLSTGWMTVLPLSLIPTFAVPLFLVLHIICIAQAMGSRESWRSQVGEPLPSTA